ncbi:MAG: hypothetical protein ABR600_06130 [Actinomycetota bacterium]
MERDEGVEEVDPKSRRVVHSFSVDGAIAVAAGEGAVWVLAKDGMLTVIDPRAGRTVDTKRVGEGIGECRFLSGAASPGSIAVGAGAVWVPDGATGNLYLINPSSHDVSVAAVVGTCPLGIAVGDGAVWVARR